MQGVKALEIEKLCRALVNDFDGQVSWSWDNRFNAVLAEFSVDKKGSFREILDRHFSTSWDSARIGDAPDRVRSISGGLGGLMAGQLLFIADPAEGVIVFCAWWPWGNEKTISLRIAPCYRQMSSSEQDEQVKLLLEWFGV